MGFDHHKSCRHKCFGECVLTTANRVRRLVNLCRVRLTTANRVEPCIDLESSF